MKKLVLVVCLIGLLIGSTLGGLALADKGGDPNLGTSTLGDINEKASTIIEGVGNVTDRLDNTDWGLEEIKTEVAAIEVNVTELKAEIESIKGDVEEILDRLNVTLDVRFTSMTRWCSANEWQVRGEVQTKGAYPVYNVDLEIFIDGTSKYTKDWDKLEPWQIYSFNSGKFGHDCTCNNGGEDQTVSVDVRGKTPWDENLTDHIYDVFDCAGP